MEDSDPKWSYAQTNPSGEVTEVREKEVISDRATAGIYLFESARTMSRAFDSMMAAGTKVNNEYYIGPSYNWLIEDGKRIASYHLGAVSRVMHGLGTPADYENFLQSNVSKHASMAARRILSI